MNESGLMPIGNHIVVRPHETEEVSPGGIFVPKTQQSKEQAAQMQADVICIGPLAFESERELQEHDVDVSCPDVGDRILIQKYAGRYVTGKDGKEYRMIKDDEVLAVCDGQWDTRFNV